MRPPETIEPQEPPKERAALQRPAAIRVESNRDELVISFRAWELRLAVWPKNVLIMGVSGIVIPLTPAAFTGLPGFLALLPVFVIGWLLLVQGLAGYLRRERIRVTRQWIELERPFLLYPNRRIAVSDVMQLYVYEDDAILESNRRLTGYALRALLRDGQEIALVGDFESPAPALHLEQRLERWLDIADVPLRDELPKPQE